jgi:hypothetical protein
MPRRAMVEILSHRNTPRLDTLLAATLGAGRGEYRLGHCVDAYLVRFSREQP